MHTIKQQVLDLEMVFDSTRTEYYMNGNLVQTSPSSGRSAQFANISGLRWGINNDPNIGAGFIDNVKVAVVPEPASLGLLALGGIAMLSRRRT